MNPEREKVLAKRLDRADAVIKYSALAAVFFVVLGFAVIIFQNYQTQLQIERNLVISRAQAAENHKKTQNYVKCIGIQLLKPIAERKKTDFDTCSVDTKQTDGNAQTNTGTGDDTLTFLATPQPTPVSTPASIPQQPQVTSSPQPPVTTSEPPKQNTPGLVSGLVLGLGQTINKLGL